MCSFFQFSILSCVFSSISIMYNSPLSTIHFIVTFTHFPNSLLPQDDGDWRWFLILQIIHGLSSCRTCCRDWYLGQDLEFTVWSHRNWQSCRYWRSCWFLWLFAIVAWSDMFAQALLEREKKLSHLLQTLGCGSRYALGCRGFVCDIWIDRVIGIFGAVGAGCC